MVVANTMHASSPASGAIIRSPAETVRARAPAQARVAATLTAIEPVIQCRAGNDTQYCAEGEDKKTGCRKEPDVDHHP